MHELYLRNEAFQRIAQFHEEARKDALIASARESNSERIAQPGLVRLWLGRRLVIIGYWLAGKPEIGV